jgi:hypothetical protein
MKSPLFVALFSVFNSYSQQAFPTFGDSAQWNVLISFFGSAGVTSSYTYEKDTVFCGYSYSKLLTQSSSDVYVRTDNVRAFMRTTSNCSDKEYLMYDYSLGPGDTAYVGYNLSWGGGPDTTPMVIQNVDFVTYFGVSRMRMELLYDSNNSGQLFEPMYWVYGIGSLTHPFYTYECLHDGCELTFTTLCYHSDQQQLYQNSSYNGCVVSAGGLGASEWIDDISIFPLPCVSDLTIESSISAITKVECYATTGVKLKEFHFTAGNKQQINVLDLPQGTYFLLIETEKGKVVRPISKV